MSALERNVLLLEMSTLQGPELHLFLIIEHVRIALKLLSLYLMCSLRFENNFLSN